MKQINDSEKSYAVPLYTWVAFQLWKSEYCLCATGVNRILREIGNFTIETMLYMFDWGVGCMYEQTGQTQRTA